jgi:hypothetical protein
MPKSLSPASKRRASLMAQANRAHQARLRSMKRINRLLLEIQLGALKNKIGLKNK